jgi:hypothetical protein
MNVTYALTHSVYAILISPQYSAGTSFPTLSVTAVKVTKLYFYKLVLYEWGLIKHTLIENIY